MANYLLIGAQELGCTIFEVDGDGRLMLHFDRDIIRKLWDSYYVPFIKGLFQRCRALPQRRYQDGQPAVLRRLVLQRHFLPPTRVMTSDTESHDITLKVLPLPEVCGWRIVCCPAGRRHGRHGGR